MSSQKSARQVCPKTSEPKKSIEINKPPRRRIGLALSGGGSKAALFAHGILHGLNDTGLLQHIDVVSTTSGGGYAAYWYFTKYLAEQDLEAQDQGWENCR